MNDKTLIKANLFSVIKEMLLSRPEVKAPLALENRILESYGFAPDLALRSPENLTEFIKHLQDWVERIRPKMQVEKSKDDTARPSLSIISEAAQTQLDVQLQYCNNLSVTLAKLEQIIIFKNSFLETSVNKCHLQDFACNVFQQKIHFLILQVFSKLYGESNGLNAHLKLRDKLLQDILHCKKEYTLALHMADKYNEMKENKEFMQLCTQFKDLKRIEKRTEIIKQI